MSNIINARSPYYIKIVDDSTEEDVTRISADVYIYTGEPGDYSEDNKRYVLSKEITEGHSNFVVFEISELVRDYLVTDLYTDAVDTAYVRVVCSGVNHNDVARDVEILGQSSDTATYIAMDGYGYFEEGINPRETDNPLTDDFTPQILMDNKTVYFIPGHNIIIPVWGDAGSTFAFGEGVSADVFWNAADTPYEEFAVTWERVIEDVTIVPGTHTDAKIQYVIISQTNALLHDEKITITSADGEQVDTITLKEICLNKYEPIRVSFYNKFGAIENFWAEMKSTRRLKSSSSKFKRNIIDLIGTPSNEAVTYNPTKHSTKTFDVMVNESITVNTNFVVESLNETFKQMIMSEGIWLEIGGIDYPVTLTTTSLTEKTNVNDKLIQYTFDFDFSFDKIQNVR